MQMWPTVPMNLPKQSKPVKQTHAVSDLRPGQQATLFPSLGYYDSRRECYRAQVHGRVFIDGKIPLGTRILLRGLKKAMKATPEQVASPTFQSRIDGFLAAPGRRRKIVLEVGNQLYRLRRRTRRNGAFYGTLALPSGTIEGTGNNAHQIPMHLLRSEDLAAQAASIQGQIYYVPQHGVSVISDIDDTIKMTGATSKREMLTNTFLKPFEVVEGMAELYRQWEATGCQFHYVSSSPWQLYEPLAELCSRSDFPSGSMHLRYFRVRDEMFKRFRPLRRNSKVGIIAGILKRLPNRKFILVGDSGEKDPEIYRFLARRYPQQIAAILIRDLPERRLLGKRLKKLHALPPDTLLRIFRKTKQVEDIVSQVLAMEP